MDLNGYIQRYLSQNFEMERVKPSHQNAFSNSLIFISGFEHPSECPSFFQDGPLSHLAVDAYNKGIDSLKPHVLFSARRFQEMGAMASKIDLEVQEIIEKKPREL